MTASDILADLSRRGGTARVLPTGKLRIEPATVVDDAFLVELREQRDAIVAELTRRKDEASGLLSQAQAAGLILTVEGEGLRVRHRTDASPDESLIAELSERKPEIIAELRRQADLLKYASAKLGTIDDADPVVADSKLSQRGVMCRVCLRVDRCFADADGAVCSGCAEWRVTGCSAFTVLERADAAAEARYGACLSCGGSIELHGSPDPSNWRRVPTLDDVRLVEIRFVIASAAAIVREARR